MSAAVDVNISDTISDENSSVEDGSGTDASAHEAGPPYTKNIFCARRDVPNRIRESSLMSDLSSTSSEEIHRWNYTEPSEMSSTGSEELVSRSGQSGTSADIAVLPARCRDISDSSDEEFITPPSPTAVSRDAENFGIQDELLCQNEQNVEKLPIGDTSLDTTQSSASHNPETLEDESVILLSSTDVSREAEAFKIEEIEFSEEIYGSEENGNGTSVTDTSPSSPTYIVELPEEDDISELTGKETINSLSPEALLNETADLAIDKATEVCEVAADVENLDVSGISMSDDDYCPHQDIIAEEIVAPPSPTDVSRDAENLGITGSTDMDMKADVEEKDNNSTNISNESSSKLVVDSDNNGEVNASNTDIAENLVKFLEAVLKITPEESHKFILHNTMSLAYFIKSQIHSAESLERVHELVKEIGCLLKRVKN